MRGRSGRTPARCGAAALAALGLCGWVCLDIAAAQPVPVRETAAPPGVPAGAGSVTLQVTVTNVRSDHGHVRVAVCPRASFLQPKCAWHAAAPAHVGSVVVPVTGIPPGVYAVQSTLDENDDETINRSLFGIPTEGIGFSNDAPMRFGPPSFGDAAIRLGPADGMISLRLRYFN